jgi:integrase
VVLSRPEVEAVLGHLQPPYRLVGLLLYGCGLRLAECVGLRVQCFNLDAMLLTVHDELVFEMPPDEVEAVGRRVENIMEGIWDLRVPLKVNLAIGSNWAEAH